MAVRYYDDAIAEKLKKWIPTASKLKVLKPDESKRLFELTADENGDQPFKLPLIALSRNNDIELLSTAKSPKSFDGLRLYPDGIKTGAAGLKGIAYENYMKSIPSQVALLNVLPIRVEYQLDIYTKKAIDGEEYMRSFLFKLINNPAIKIEIPYNDLHIEHIANLRVQSSVSDTSDISEHLFAGQFTRWTIQLELQDAFLFNIPYKDTWRIIDDGSDPIDFVGEQEEHSVLELSDSIEQEALEEDKEQINVIIKK